MLHKVIVFKMFLFTNTVVLYTYMRKYLNRHMMLGNFQLYVNVNIIHTYISTQ